MNIDFMAMIMDVVNSAIGVAQGLAMGGDMITLGIAVGVIVLAALFMSSLEQLISTTMTALFAFVVVQVVYTAFNADWAFDGPVNDMWASFAGDGGLSFFVFFSYFLVFAIAIAIVNIVKGMVAG